MSDDAALIAEVSRAMELADDSDGLIGWDCFADETIVDFDALAEVAVVTVRKWVGKMSKWVGKR